MISSWIVNRWERHRSISILIWSFLLLPTSCVRSPFSIAAPPPFEPMQHRSCAWRYSFRFLSPGPGTVHRSNSPAETASLRGPQVTSSKCFSWLRSIIHIIMIYRSDSPDSPQQKLPTDPTSEQSEYCVPTAPSRASHPEGMEKEGLLLPRVQIW